MNGLRNQWQRGNIQLFTLAVGLLVGLMVISQVNYLLFHTLAEMFSVVIASTIFILTWNSRGYLNNSYLLVLGLSFLFTAGLDLLHTLAFKGMGVFANTNDPINGPNLATQLWLCARYVQAGAFVTAPLFFGRSLRPWTVLLVFSAITSLLLASIFVWPVFPTAFMAGITPFKRYSEYAIILLLLVSGLQLKRVRLSLDPDVHRLLLASVAVTAFSELAFTEYLAINDFFNMTGHFLKIIAFALIYKAIVETGFRKPNKLLFRELNQSEAREQARSAQLAAIMDAVPAMVRMASDPDGRVLIGNRAAAELFGIASMDGQAGPPGTNERPFRTFDWHERELSPEERPLVRVMREGQPVREFEEMLLFENGDRRYLFGNVSPLFDEHGRVSGAVSALVDMTARVQAERALQESEGRLRRLVEANIIGIVYTGLDGQVGQANDAFLDLIGSTRADLLAGRVNWMHLTPPEYQEQDRIHNEEVIERGACTPFEKEYIRVDGRRVPVLIGFAYFKGAELPFICFVLDLTEQKAAEGAAARYAAQLEASNDELERAVNDLEFANREFERANRELERANRELQDFAFVASHDLQEPLRKIQAFGERLNTQASGLDPEARDYLERMLKAATRMRNMINDLLTLSRVTTRAHPFELVDLNQVAANVISDLEVRIERTGALVEVCELPVIEADPTQMHQLLQNLIANALKFQPEDGQPHIRVDCALAAKQGSVLLSVTDNGIGFESQYIERIFQPFQRLHGVGHYEGSGMGLAICRKIVERHNGAIEAHSVPGEGTRFVITLPVHVLGSL